MSFGRLLSQSLLLSFCSISLGVSLSQAQSVANFVSMAPCRIMDTRDPRYGASFGPPSLLAQTSRDFPILSSACGVPQGTLAYSFNVTAIPHGSLPWLKIWPTGQAQPAVSTLNSYSGSVVANAAIVPAGTNGSISIYVEGSADVLLDINGYFVVYTPPTIPTIPVTIAQSNKGIQSTALGAGASSLGTQNTAVGDSALLSNTSPTFNTGNGNTAFGASALAANSSGNNNVGIGASALTKNAQGSSNTAVGTQSLSSNGTGNSNTAIGAQALQSHYVGDYNTAVGFSAMSNDTGSQNNVAMGYGALSGSSIGNNNIAVGVNAGNPVDSNAQSLPIGSSNIEIGNVGQTNDSNTIRIGTPCSVPCAAGQQQFTYVAGIFGTAVNFNSASTVFVDASGKLGTFKSSRRYKEDIQDMGTSSDSLMQLRPVRFRYKQAAPDGSKPLQFGLIAEEVAQVYPELVVRDDKGQIESVQYQQLPAMLLNELQKQHQTIARQEREIQALESRLAALEDARARVK